MSYDLAVFDSGLAPQSEAEFRNWFHEQTQWTESHGYNDPQGSCLGLEEFVSGYDNRVSAYERPIV